MQLTIENDALQEALKIISRLAAPVSGAIMIESDGKKCWLKSVADISRCTINVPAAVEGKPHKFNVNLQSFMAATKGRKTLTIEYAKTMCKIASGSYRIELATEDAMELDYDDEEIESTVSIESEQAQWLKSALTVIGLKPTLLLASFMPVVIKLTDKGAFVCCYDKNHMAYIKSEDMTGDMELMLPQDMLAAVLDVFYMGKFKIKLSRSSVYVSNRLVQIVMSRPEPEEDALTIDEILMGVKASKAKGVQLVADKKQVQQFLDNARAINGKERSEVKVEVAKGVLEMLVTTGTGTARSKFKVENNRSGSAIIDFEYLEEAVRKSDSKAIIKIVEADMATFDLKLGSVVVSLNQED